MIVEREDLTDTDTQDELVEAYLDYFKEIEQYRRRRSYRTAIKARKSLSKIIDLCRQRRKEISADHAVEVKNKRELVRKGSK
jgi:hypothetical protein